MPTQIKVWEISGNKLASRDNSVFADSHREDELENWIAHNPEILGEKLLIIERQLRMPDGGRLDLLGMDENGKLVIIELKRDLGPREAVAQALDYVSWLDAASEDEILTSVNQYLQSQPDDSERDLAQAFEETFSRKLPEWVCQNHRVLLVAAGLDASAERIVNYLARRAIDINAVFFNYCELSDAKQILVRSVLVPESAKPPKPLSEPAPTEAGLLAMADERKTTELVKICRHMREVVPGQTIKWWEAPEDTAQGSFRYWAGERVVYGINASGKLGNAPVGELDIWVRPDKLAEVIGVPEQAIRDQLSHFTPFRAGRMDFVIRLKNIQSAEALVSELKRIAKGDMAKGTAAPQS